MSPGSSAGPSVGPSAGLRRVLCLGFDCLCRMLSTWAHALQAFGICRTSDQRKILSSL